MKKLIKLEVGKAIKNKFFISAVLVGCAITVLSFVYKVNVYEQHLFMLKEIKSTSVVTSNPLPAMFSLYNSWIGGEPFSMGSSIYFFVFPLLVTIPYGWSYCEEKNNGYARLIIVRSGKSTYLFSKYIATFLSGGLAMVLPLIFSILLTATVFPAIKPEVIYDTAYGVFGQSLMSILYYTKPLLYVLFYLMIDFAFGGLIACMSFCASSMIKYRVIVVILPLFLCLALHYGRQFVYTSYEVRYKEISPLYFLRPVSAAYDTSWSVVLIEMIALLVATLFISVIGGRKRDVY